MRSNAGRIGAKHPFEQRGQEARAVQRACVARSRYARGELIENWDRTIVRGDHLVLADDTLKRVQLPFIVLTRRIAGDV
jgi:hypothetical protein